jgi:ribosomal protein S18 acetylase RimI-like enzyme
VGDRAVSTEVTFRRPVEADHRFLVDRVDEWWGGRKVRQLLPRLWLRHFTGTSWIAEDPSGAIVGFLVGFISPDDPANACIHMAATSPNQRRNGLGRALYDRFLADARASGVRRVTAVTWPGNQVSVGFHRAMGFLPDEGPGTQRLYGTPAYPDYDGDGQDRVVFSLDL